MNNTATKTNCLSWFGGYDALVTWVTGLTFLLAGVPHWDNTYFFLGSVYSYKIVDPGFGQMVAMSLPLIQLILAVFLLTRVFIDTVHLSCLFLFLCFATVQTIAYFRGLDISCGCFGPGHETTIGFRTLSLVYFLLFLSVTRNIGRFFWIRSAS